MSEKLHNSAPLHSILWPWRKAWIVPTTVTIVLWIVLTLMIGEMGRLAPDWMERLAAGDPDPARHREQDALRVTRALLRTAPQPTANDILWSARHGGAEAGFYLAGAVIEERRGRPASAALWLALDALAKSQPGQARPWQAMAPPDFPWPAPTTLGNPDWMDQTEAGRWLRSTLNDPK